MDEKFSAFAESLAPKLALLVSMPPIAYGSLPLDMPKSGVYLFSEGGKHLYVGRSNTLRDRYGRHCRPGTTHRQAAFAFLLAREETGLKVATYRAGEGTRADLAEQPAFRDAFIAAKARIRKMEYRYVREDDQTSQALLEIYCAVVLGTPYNDFSTH